jgi:hypothetical protein
MTIRDKEGKIPSLIPIGDKYMDFPWPIKILIAITIVILFWYMLESMIWGLLIYVAALSIMAATATWVDGRSERKTGSRLLIWFLNRDLLMELLGFSLGLLAGGTGTLTGLNYAITTGIVATIFRWGNTTWKTWKGVTLVDQIYKKNMPSDWRSDETLKQAIGFSSWFSRRKSESSSSRNKK